MRCLEALQACRTTESVCARAGTFRIVSRPGLGPSLLAARERAELSAQAAAGAIGRKPETLQRWEAGESRPSLSDVVALADLYKTTLDELVGREPHRPGVIDRLRRVVAGEEPVLEGEQS
jgi:transcriptional regulator with XRE-family HTH domain